MIIKNIRHSIKSLAVADVSLPRLTVTSHQQRYQTYTLLQFGNQPFCHAARNLELFKI